MIWVGTSHGICRFNGYEFVRPVDTSGTEYSSTMEIQEDHTGRIWFNRLNGRLWYIENDTVRAWKYNRLLDSLPAKTRYSLRFSIARDGSVWLGTWEDGFIVVSSDGRLQKRRQPQSFLIADINGAQLLARDISGADDDAYRRQTGRTPLIYRVENDGMRELGRFPADYSMPSQVGFWMWPISKGRAIGQFLHGYYLLEGDQLVWHGTKAALAKSVVELNNGALLAAMISGDQQGLYRYRTLDDFKNEKFDNLLPGISVARIIVDRAGGWWAGSNKSGLFYCKNPQLEVYDQSSGLPANEVTALSSDGDGKVFAGLRQFDIAVLHRHGEAPGLLPRSPVTEMYLLRYDTATGRLWAANNLCYFDGKKWRVAKKKGEKKENSHLPAKKIAPDYAGKFWWVCTGSGVYQIDPASATGDGEGIDTLEGLRSFSVSQDIDGVLWVTSKDGLKFWRDGQLIPPLFSHPALRNNPLHVEHLPASVGGGQVLALISGGLLIRDGKGSFTHLRAKDGLTTDMILGLVVRSDGVIYGLSNAGLNILTFKGNGKWEIETLTVKHGLPSNQVNDVVALGDEIWIATDGGVVRFRKKPDTAPIPSPMLEKFRVNNETLPFSQNLVLDHTQNNLSLRFFSLHYRSEGDIPYRYRLLGADTAFIYTRNREVNFVHLSPGVYTFEVQGQNEEGRWSEAAQWSFRILPPWWARTWFLSLSALAAAAAIWLFFHHRLQSVKKEAKVREKVRELESAALRAQMNPHFIFNCLQAIQAFVAKNEREAASTYLARFAKLVRLSLHSSVDGRHSLRDEIAMLDNYLHLEQLRFGHTFDFDIKVAPELGTDDISLPPLLIQPFVENAVIHGLQGRKSGGKVSVAFSAEGENLEIEISDNGKGFESEPAEAPRLSGHKSVGMLLTQKRLDLLNGKEMPVLNTPVEDANGNICGTAVKIRIPI